MKFKIDRIISIATLAASLAAICLVLKKPAPVAQPQVPAATEEHAGSIDQNVVPSGAAANQSQGAISSSPRASASAVAPTSTRASGGAENSPLQAQPKVNSDEISAVLAQALGAAGSAGLTPDSNIGSGAPPIKDQQISVDGDLVHGQFLTEIAGKDVWVTIAGHIGEKDGYATFDPTEFKVGDLEVPVSLVNPALQKKLAEERDRLKVPNN